MARKKRCLAIAPNNLGLSYPGKQCMLEDDHMGPHQPDPSDKETS